jgi:hypothetical protein
LNTLFRGTQQQTILLQTKEKVFGQLEEFINIGVDK